MRFTALFAVLFSNLLVCPAQASGPNGYDNALDPETSILGLTSYDVLNLTDSLVLGGSRQLFSASVKDKTMSCSMEVDESSTGFNGYPHTVAKDEWLYVSGVNVTDDHHAVVSFTGGVIRKLDCVIGEGSPSWDSSPLWIS